MYRVEFTDEQMRLVENSLDLFSRVLMGQVEEIGNVLRWHSETIYDHDGNPVDWENVNAFVDIVRSAKRHLGMHPNAHHGIYNDKITDDARKAYDIEKTLAFHRHWHDLDKDPDTDERDWKLQLSHWYDTPDKHSFDEKFNLPKVEVIKD